jgi:hypothetical protein
MVKQEIQVCLVALLLWVVELVVFHLVQQYKMVDQAEAEAAQAPEIQLVLVVTELPVKVILEDLQILDYMAEVVVAVQVLLVEMQLQLDRVAQVLAHIIQSQAHIMAAAVLDRPAVQLNLQEHPQ